MSYPHSRYSPPRLYDDRRSYSSSHRHDRYSESSEYHTSRSPDVRIRPAPSRYDRRRSRSRSPVQKRSKKEPESTIENKQQQQAYNKETTEKLKQAVDAALAICAINQKETGPRLNLTNKPLKAPELDQDINTLFKDKPDLLPELNCHPEFPDFKTLKCPNNFDKEALSKMMRRWYRYGFVTGYYRAYARKKFNEEKNKDKEEGEVR